MKATAFRQLAAQAFNSNWRAWYLGAARELEGAFDPAQFTRGMTTGANNADFAAILPPKVWVERHTTRLRAEATLAVHYTVGFRFADVKEECGLEIRRGVAQFHDRMPEKPELVLTLERKTLEAILRGERTLPETVAEGATKVEGGDGAAVEQFFNYFERPFETPVRLVVR